MFLVLCGDAILHSRFRDPECSENRFLSSALGHLNVSFQIWWWLGLWSFKRFKLHQDEKGKEVHGKWKKERKWYSFFPLIYLLHQCLQIALGIGNEFGPRSATCVGRAGSRVCHPGGAASYRRAVKHLQRAFFRMSCTPLWNVTRPVFKCYTCVAPEVITLWCVTSTDAQVHKPTNRRWSTRTHTHTHTQTVSQSVNLRYKHVGALKHAWQAKVRGGQQVIMRGGGD